MAKKASKHSSSAKSKSSSSNKSRFSWTEWGYATTVGPEISARWRQTYWGLLGLSALLLIVLAMLSGINADEKFQDDYSQKLLSYYSTFGEDKAALYEGDESSQRYNKFYGGFFEVLSAGVNKVLGNEPGVAYHQVRHFINALFGFLIIFIAGRWSRQLGGYRAGVFTLLLLLASPRLLGHGVMNPKDIPFAAGYLMGAYFLYRCLLQMPKPRWQDLLGLTVGAALATATRAGGILVFCYAGLFMGLDFLLRYGFKGIFSEGKLFLRYALYWGLTTVVGFGLALLFWPYALESPIAHTREALAIFSQYAVRIIILFGGENIFSDAIPTTYPLIWLGISLALSVLLGMIGGLALLNRLGKAFGRMPVYLLAFVGLFPLIYIMVQDSALYDGWRQLLFIYPSLVVVAGLFYEWAQRQLGTESWKTYAVLGAILVLSADAYVFTLRNAAFPYVYFNPVAGGIKGAHGNYETDYWGLSTRQAIEWMEDEGILHAGMTDTLIIGTTFPYNVQRQLGAEYRDHVKVQYVRIHQRYNEFWDYGIFPSRFVRGAHLRSGNWPVPTKTIHTITANGVPLTAIERDEDQFAMQGQLAAKEGRFGDAIEFYQQETANHPLNELGWSGLGSAYINANQPERAIGALDKALEVAPDNETAIYLRGYANLQKGDINQAMQEFNYLLRVDPENAMAFYFLGEIYRQRNDPNEAL
ncbi:MAG: tetratricopeptide repeat protein, partial [Lewinella sp.]|nr:tetratricopeptide repeat protein [Lewinella sp.]